MREAVDRGTLREIGHGQVVTIPADPLHEPSFHTVFTGGSRHLVLPGNREFSVGDRLPRSSGGGGAGGGIGAAEGGAAEDPFRFVLTREEFLDLFFEDLELPDLVKRQIVETEALASIRAGISVAGMPSQLDLSRTMRQSVSRRVGLRRPKPDDVRKLMADIEDLEANGGDRERLDVMRAELMLAMRRLARVPWIDPVDLRYRRFALAPRPSSRAVMFCLMDVSGSMTEEMKALAKRFFLLLRVFLERRYRRVEMIFIRHTDMAEEVDEETFFTDPRTGGTVVSSALAELIRIQRKRYPADSWNIYAAQASDGDNLGGDTARAVSMLEANILPVVQYFAYIEIAAPGMARMAVSDLWRGYEAVAKQAPSLALRRVSERHDIFPVFRDLFAKRMLAS